jgi:hypothetical protein
MMTTMMTMTTTMMMKGKKRIPANVPFANVQPERQHLHENAQFDERRAMIEDLMWLNVRTSTSFRS